VLVAFLVANALFVRCVKDWPQGERSTEMQGLQGSPLIVALFLIIPKGQI
jgi:hypothetical protein